MIKGIDVIFIHAKDPQKLSSWYEEKLDMEIKIRTPDLGWQEYKMVNDSTPTRFAIDFPGEKASGPHLQPLIISFRVDNIFNMINKLEDRGISFYGKKKVQDSGETLFATFKDPEDNWLQISQRKKKEA